ncbi:hypothetical protein [Pseudodesulfovibrio tunisiensis]|uniref:hypothetical protein n=1 Tax=Pseudodesulfovibrio tunisiensis TaxID=463192 RepID=UPI00311EF9FA
MPGFSSIYALATYAFDPLHQYWERESTQRRVGGLLIFVFLLSLGAIELNRQGLLPSQFTHLVPSSHYMAISLAFTLVLILEVVSLIFTLPCSISRAVGKQFEILALILLRNSFKELAEFPEPITVAGHMDAVWRLLADGGGAIAIFGLLGVYTLLRYRLEESLRGGPRLFRFVASKKIVALVLLCVFLVMGLENARLFVSGQPTFHFFKNFYTVLIFSDILLVLISQRFLPEFRAVFRNSGFVLSTLLIRLALTAPPSTMC